MQGGFINLMEKILCAIYLCSRLKYKFNNYLVLNHFKKKKKYTHDYYFIILITKFVE